MKLSKLLSLALVLAVALSGLPYQDNAGNISNAYSASLPR